MRFIRSIAVGLLGLVATFALKKVMAALEAQLEKARTDSEIKNPPKDLKQLKQDPATGVYYAED
jgi:hypothetical protein